MLEQQADIHKVNTQKILYIHAGGPKTGSTSLQQFFAINEQLLLERHNIYFPQTSRFSTKKFLHIRHNAKSFLSETKNLNALITELQENCAHNFIISEERIGENFQVNAHNVDMIKSSLPNHNIKVIFYLRKIDEQIRSLYSQHVKSGFIYPIRSYPEYINKLASERPSMMFYSEMIEKFQEWFGSENVILRIYQREVLHGYDIVDDFFDAINIRLSDDFARDKDINLSLNTKLTPFLTRYIRKDDNKVTIEDEILRLAENISLIEHSIKDQDNITRKVCAEIDRLEQYCPGYKNLFDTTGVNLDFPEMNAEPYQLFLIGLLYSLLYDTRDIKHNLTAFSQSVTQELTEAKAELTKTKADLNSYQKNLQKTQDELAVSRNKLKHSQKALETSQAELELVKKQVQMEIKYRLGSIVYSKSGSLVGIIGMPFALLREYRKYSAEKTIVQSK